MSRARAGCAAGWLNLASPQRPQPRSEQRQDTFRASWSCRSRVGGAAGWRRRSVQQPLSPTETPTGTESSRGTHSYTRAARPRRQAQKRSLEKKAAVSRSLSQTPLRLVNARAEFNAHRPFEAARTLPCFPYPLRDS